MVLKSPETSLNKLSEITTSQFQVRYFLIEANSSRDVQALRWK